MRRRRTDSSRSPLNRATTSRGLPWTSGGSAGATERSSGTSQVLPYARVTMLEDEELAGQQLLHASEERVGSCDVTRAEELRDCRDVGLRIDEAAGENGLDLGSEEQQVPAPCPVQRLDAQPIAREQQPPLRRIPDGKREHAAEPVNAIVTPLLVGVHDRFSVGLRAVAVPALLEVAPDRGVVVDLPVVDDPDRAVFVRERLLAGAQVDDTQTPVGEDGVGVAVQAHLVRSAMRKDVAHRHRSVFRRAVDSSETIRFRQSRT